MAVPDILIVLACWMVMLPGGVLAGAWISESASMKIKLSGSASGPGQCRAPGVLLTPGHVQIEQSPRP